VRGSHKATGGAIPAETQVIAHPMTELEKARLPLGELVANLDGETSSVVVDGTTLEPQLIETTNEALGGTR